MKSVLSFPIFYFLSVFIHAQTYTDYLGAGHNAGITVTSSSEMQRNGWNEKAAADNTINGKGMDSRLLETSRFLAQATFGCPLSTIQTVAGGSYEQWIEDQFTRPSTPLAQRTAAVYETAKAMYIANGGNGEDYFGPSLVHFVYAWWDHNMKNEDLMRQSVALALSEIEVISSN